MRSIFLFLLFISSFLTAQVHDDFSDSDFTNNPTWIGDTADFIVINGLLRSNSNTSSYGFYLSTSSTTATDAQWEFYVNLKLQTSSANYTDIYLISDEANLKSTTNSGYFVRIGNTTDEISLYKRTSGINVEIIDGLDAEVNSSNNTIQVKVTRDTANLWTLQSNLKGNGFSYETEGVITDASITTCSYFGVFVQQSTPTFHLNHFYDNFYIGPILIDITPPSIVSSTIISNTQVDVLFDEFIDLTSSEITSNYSADNGLGNPIAVIRDVSNFNLVHLTFSTAFTNGLSNTLTVANVQDLNQNIGITSTTIFSFVIPESSEFKDVVINEIFADPSPQIGLPAAEFLEIYNKSEQAFDLKGWKLTDGPSIATLSSYTLSPGMYLIICPKADTAAYGLFGNVMGVSSFPVLNNAGDHIYLKNNALIIIDSVNYSDTWYRDATKKGGGWSLELINPNIRTNCPMANYWMASTNALGGTPGTINSTYTNVADNEAPQLLSASTISKDTLLLNFNESLDASTLLNTAIYSIDKGIGIPIEVKAIAPDFKNVQLIVGTALQAGIIYTISLTNAITDCAGIPIGPYNTASFVIPESAMPNDIVINEILFDPKTDGIDFVEIYNRSNKIIDLKTITLSQYDTINNTLTSIEKITTESYLIHPGEYILLSENSAIVKNQYHTTNPSGFINMSNLPAMNIASGTVCLANSTDIIDLFQYYENMHFPLLNVTKGVSLERIDFNRPTQDKTNWHSAAEAVGFATPAYQNSQYSKAGETDNAIEIAPDIFSPDEDGMNDIFNVHYHFDTPGLIANITIYDSKGRSVKQLVRNELLGVTGTFSWDGIDENREKAKIGIYVVFVEVFDLTGKTRHYKKTCVLASKI